MAHNDPRRRLPPSQIPGHQLYPLLSQLTPLPNLAHIKHENPGGNPGGIPGIHHLATSHHAVVPGKDREAFRTLVVSLVQMTTFISRIFFKLVELQFKVPISAE